MNVFKWLLALIFGIVLAGASAYGLLVAIDTYFYELGFLPAPDVPADVAAAVDGQPLWKKVYDVAASGVGLLAGLFLTLRAGLARLLVLLGGLMSIAATYLELHVLEVISLADLAPEGMDPQILTYIVWGGATIPVIITLLVALWVADR